MVYYMQPLKGIFEAIGSDKRRLFVLILFLVISASAIPAIVPHMSHTTMVYHILVHTLGLIIAIFLSTGYYGTTLSLLFYNECTKHYNSWSRYRAFPCYSICGTSSIHIWRPQGRQAIIRIYPLDTKIYLSTNV